MFLILDFETTGLDPKVHEPTQVAALLLDDCLREIASFSCLIMPERIEAVDAAALAIQGRTLADLDCALPVAAALGLLVQFASALAEDPHVVGHNVGFDLAILSATEQTHALRVPRQAVALDTCLLSRVHLEAPGLIADAKLTTVATHYRLAHVAHDALGDVRATAQVLARIREEDPELFRRALDGTVLSGLLDDAQRASPENPFVVSCAQQYRDKGYLSPKQIGALVRTAQASCAPPMV